MLDVPAQSEVNLVLRQLPDGELDVVRSLASAVELVTSQVICEHEGEVEHAYFLSDGMVSVVTTGPPDASGVEVGTVGREGVVGVAAIFEPRPLSFGRMIVQMPGHAWRVPAGPLLDAAPRLPVLRHLCFNYVQASLAQTMQSAACNVTHTLLQRTAKWILIAHDHVDGDEVALKQEFLANMLGVRRPGVSGAVATLQEAGLIHTSRGRITILDRPQLERTSCRCYLIAAKTFQRLLGGPTMRPKPSPLLETSFAPVGDPADQPPKPPPESQSL